MKYTFDTFEFDCLKGELRQNNQLIQLEPQVCQLLTMLIARHGDFVSREEILKEIWADRNVSPNVIDNRIRAARMALNDDGRRQRYIKTYPNRGFRFIGEINADKPETTMVTDILDETVATELLEKPNIFTRYKSALSVLAGSLLIGSSALYMDGDIHTSWLGEDKVTQNNTQPVIAVLPIKNIQDNSSSEQYGLHLTEVMINTLSKMSSLAVISSLSSFQVATQPINFIDASNTLGADYLVTNTVWRDGDSVNAIVQFVRSNDGVVEWSKTFREKLNNVSELTIETKIAREAAISISNHLGIPSDFALDDTIAKDIHSLFIKSDRLVDSDSGGDILEAISNYRQVTLKEPSYAPTYLKLAYAYHRAVKHSGFPATAANKEIEKFSRTALALAPKSPEAMIAQGLAAQNGSHLNKALKLYDEALAIKPNHNTAIILRAEVLELLGDIKEAGKALERALIYDPISPDVLYRLARIKFGNGQIEEAVALARQNHRWNIERIEAHIILGQFSREIGDYAESYRMLTQALKMNPTHFDAQFQYLLLMASLGRIEEALPSLTISTIKAFALAFSGNEMEARQLSTEDPRGQMSSYVEYIYGDSKPLYDHFIKTGLRSKYKDIKNTISLEHTFDVADKAHIYRENGDDDFKLLIKNLNRYFSNKPPSDLKTEEEFIAAMALLVLEGKYNEALEIIDQQTTRGLLSISNLERSPVFTELRNKPEFKARIDKMREAAHSKWQRISGIITSN